MARPKRKNDEPGVPERLESVFFEMLREMPYGDITVSSLVQRTGVNHNTFYYYFGNIDDFASQVIVRTLSSDIPNYILNSFTGDKAVLSNVVKDKDFQRRFERLSLLVGTNSSGWIIKRLKESILQLWFTSLGIDVSHRSDAQVLMFHFWLGGVLSVWEKLGHDCTPDQFISAMENDITRTFISLVKELKSD